MNGAEARAIAPQLEQGRQELKDLALLLYAAQGVGEVTVQMARLTGFGAVPDLVARVTGMSRVALDTATPVVANAVNVAAGLVERAAGGDADAAIKAARIIVAGKSAAEAALETVDIRVVGARFIDEVVVPTARQAASVGMGIGVVVAVGFGLYVLFTATR